jgi:hypothetical protein
VVRLSTGMCRATKVALGAQPGNLTASLALVEWAR